MVAVLNFTSLCIIVNLTYTATSSPSFTGACIFNPLNGTVIFLRDLLICLKSLIVGSLGTLFEWSCIWGLHNVFPFFIFYTL